MTETKRQPAEPNWLHVYPAPLWHDSVAIIGTQQALRHLAERLLAAADAGTAIADCCANDGEGYWLDIVRVDDLANRSDIPCHYVDELADGPKVEGHLPRRILRQIDAAHRRARSEEEA